MSVATNPGHIVVRYVCACDKPPTGRQPMFWPAPCGGVIVLNCTRIPPSSECWVPGEGFEVRIAH